MLLGLCAVERRPDVRTIEQLDRGNSNERNHYTYADWPQSLLLKTPNPRHRFPNINLVISHFMSHSALHWRAHVSLHPIQNLRRSVPVSCRGDGSRDAKLRFWKTGSGYRSKSHPDEKTGPSSSLVWLRRRGPRLQNILLPWIPVSRRCSHKLRKGKWFAKSVSQVMFVMAWYPYSSQVNVQKYPREMYSGKFLDPTMISSPGRPTNDRRYESKDSRDIEKGSFSLTRSRWFDDLVEPGYLRQKLCFSGGEGWLYLSQYIQSNAGMSVLEGRPRCHRQLQVTMLAISVCKNWNNTMTISHHEWHAYRSICTREDCHSSSLCSKDWTAGSPLIDCCYQLPHHWMLQTSCLGNYGKEPSWEKKNKSQRIIRMALSMQICAAANWSASK